MPIYFIFAARLRQSIPKHRTASLISCFLKQNFSLFIAKHTFFKTTAVRGDLPANSPIGKSGAENRFCEEPAAGKRLSKEW